MNYKQIYKNNPIDVVLPRPRTTLEHYNRNWNRAVSRFAPGLSITKKIDVVIDLEPRYDIDAQEQYETEMMWED